MSAWRPNLPDEHRRIGGDERLQCRKIRQALVTLDVTEDEVEHRQGGRRSTSTDGFLLGPSPGSFNAIASDRGSSTQRARYGACVISVAGDFNIKRRV